MSDSEARGPDAVTLSRQVRMAIEARDAKLGKARAEIEQLQRRLAFAETSLSIWDESKTSEYWERYSERIAGSITEDPLPTKGSDDKRSCPNCFQRAVVKDGPGAWKCLNCDFENRPLLEQNSPDVSKCPNCHGPADNGHDRCNPPNPYLCSRCERVANL